MMLFVFTMPLSFQVINLYLELLKEREGREPKKFLKCHFFNTFFYKKVCLFLSDRFFSIYCLAYMFGYHLHTSYTDLPAPFFSQCWLHVLDKHYN